MINRSLMSKFRHSVAGRRVENGGAIFQLQTGRLILLFLLGCFWTAAACAQGWRPAGDNLKTEWTQQVRPDSVLPEYPRPELERVQWQNLNGLWDYAVTDVKALNPGSWQGKILVPFCIESSLSGVQKHFTGANCLWYHRDFLARRASGGGHLLIHFGACDWRTVVFLNGDLVGSHAGGYDPFTFDLTPFLRDGDTQSLTVQVFDSTDEGEPITGADEDKPFPSNQSDQPRGKQTLLAEDPNYFFHNITYTAVSGIWQTVWLEQVPSQYITNLEVHPDLDTGRVSVTATTQGGAGLVTVAVQSPDGRRITDGSGPANAPIRLSIPEPQPWSPDHPALYGLEVTFGPDRVRSYFGFRKIERRRDARGIDRFYLNNHPIFLYGPLDQGYWPDGIYTAPTDAALRHDLEVEKRFGFNCVRKHIKVEPARWYYWADHLGLLVWQDFPALSPVLDSAHTLNHPDFERPPAAKAQIETEMHRMVATLSCHPSVIIWTVFNEAWGQYDTQRVTDLFKRWDPTRLVDGASGCNDRRCGDLFD
jgi:beta-galactosidase/beta-glucuronidase